MELSDLPLLVPISAFSDFIQCSICMTQLKSTHTTACGHRYCEGCIKEWVGRQHNCPCCNHPLQNDQLIKDHQFDGLIACVLQEQDKSETQYFETLIAKATDGPKESSSLQTPVESVLKRHLLSSLASHEKFCQELKKDFTCRTERLTEGVKKNVSELGTHGLSADEIRFQTEDLQNSLERQLADLTKELESCMEMVAAAYDKHLSNHIPSLDILPVKVSIYLLEKDVRLNNIQLRPGDSLSQVQTLLEYAMAERNDPIVSIGEDVKWLVFGPFAKGSNWEMQAVAGDIIEQQGSTDHPGVGVIQDKSMISVQYGIKPNSELVVWGQIKCESDMPKQCFVKIFSPEEPKSVDYFSCKQCGFNWVCRSCMEVCHQGHNTVPYIMNHQPTWACCYCPKKKTCVIQDGK